MNSADCLLGKMKRKRFTGPQGSLAGALRAIELLAGLLSWRRSTILGLEDPAVVNLVARQSDATGTSGTRPREEGSTTAWNVLCRRYLQPETGPRAVYMVQDTPTSCHWEQAFSPDGGKTWETSWVQDITQVR